MSKENDTGQVVSDIRDRVSEATSIGEGIARLITGVLGAIRDATSDEQKDAVATKLDENSNVFANAVLENVEDPKV